MSQVIYPGAGPVYAPAPASPMMQMQPAAPGVVVVGNTGRRRRYSRYRRFRRRRRRYSSSRRSRGLFGGSAVTIIAVAVGVYLFATGKLNGIFSSLGGKSA